MEKKHGLSTPQLFVLGFTLIITVGAALLLLPFSNAAGRAPQVLDALFMATSATCVTGLSVFDVYGRFSFFGQLVILLLIQTGGLGFMTMATLLSLAAGRRIGLRERISISEAIASEGPGGVVRLVRRILTGTLCTELLGAALLFIRFSGMYEFPTALWLSIFHAVSAFCNAGFDLMGISSAGSSLTAFSGDALVLLTLCALILIGGLGFIVWNDLFDCRFRFKRLRLHSKIMLIFSAGLILIPWALFFITERGAAFEGMGAGQQVLNALFCAITPRTAGFYAVDTASLSGGGRLLTTLLMIIGAGSGSTGGGLKVTTIAVIAMCAAAQLRGREEANFLRRRIPVDLCRRAFITGAMYLALASVASFAVAAAQPLPLGDVIFECFSAIGTVGLSAGITASLSAFPKIVIMLLMFAGRVGSLTVFMAVIDRRDAGVRYPEGHVVIG